MRKYRYGNRWQGQKVKAVIVGKEIEKIIEENSGAIIPETIVRRAKPKKSPIHNCFEWDDKVAAHLYRVEQASHLLRSVTVVTQAADDETIEVRAFPNIKSEGGSYYTTIARVMDDVELSDQLESQILRELTYLRNKHKAQKTFRDVWHAVDALSK